MYKKGDRVEYCGEVVEITQIFESGDSCMVSNGTLEAYAHLSDLDEIKSAHDKLIELGYEVEQFDGYKVYRHIDKARIGVYEDKTYVCTETDLELSRILTQYLEELE